MGSYPRFFGKASLGTKGQIVIPAEARKAMGINPGDNLIIMSGPPGQNKMISIIPEEEFSKFLKFFEDHVNGLKEAIKKPR